MNVLFLLHGVGQHAPGWTGDPVGALENAMTLYRECFPAGSKLKDHVKVVEIRYDDIFDTVLERWAELANALPAGVFTKVADILESAGDDRNIFARYGGDVILYAGFRLVARAVRLRVNALIASTIHEENAAALSAVPRRSPPRFGLVAHSLGTAIAQDALHQLATGQWAAEEHALAADVASAAAAAGMDQEERESLATSVTPTRPGTLAVRLHGLFLVSDTSPVLKQSGYYSEHQLSAGVYDCDAAWSINHELDPISHVGGAFTGTWRPDRKEVRLRHLHDKNIHAFAHYLAHPAVHCPIFQLLIPRFSIACYQRAQALAAQPEWNGFGGALATWLEGEKNELMQKLQQAAQGELREAIEGYFRRIGLL